MSAEQELRDSKAFIDKMNPGPNGQRLSAAVGRLLEPIPEEVREQMFQGLPTSHVIEWYRAWLIRGDE